MSERMEAIAAETEAAPIAEAAAAAVAAAGEEARVVAPLKSLSRVVSESSRLSSLRERLLAIAENPGAPEPSFTCSICKDQFHVLVPMVHPVTGATVQAAKPCECV